ncbi:L,D-transpeptidase [Pendulispora albinea]|uniref:L,D-transpeptidase n=1 Tax=Pendulispora albinea TaxID=2741071 RepID=A0ABZ2LP35_9BACT
MHFPRRPLSKSLVLTVCAGSIVWGVATGCSQDSSPQANGPEADAGPQAPSTVASGTPAAPGKDPKAPSAELPDAAAAWDGPLLGALFMQTPVMSDMEWPIPEGSRIRDPAREKVVRIGYLRKGSKVPVIPEAHRKPNCTDGWYELVQGGFVCGRYATLDLNHPTLRLQAPHAPDMNAPLPYQYGYNLTHGMPLYKNIPSREERLEYEPWLSGRARARRAEESASSDLDAGAGWGTNPNDPFGVGVDTVDASTPWYLQKFDGGKPQITLDELRGEEGGPVVRRMVRGFFLALDKQEEHPENHSKWWKTTGGLYAPVERIVVQRLLTEFHGVWLQDPLPGVPTISGNPPTTGDAGAYGDGGAPLAAGLPTKLPVGFILWRGHKWTLTADKKRAVRGEPLPRFTAVGLTGKSITVNGFGFWETEEGWWMRNADGQIARQTTPPKDLAPEEKWIDVNLKAQTVVLYSGSTPVYATVGSTGKKSPIKEKNHETKPGSFRIREKHIAATMDGDVASDGPYSIEDVPWIMYFNGSIALHGAFWHSNFGVERSHGCVNLSPMDARAIFQWSDPPLPEGWHGVMSTPDRPGSRVVVREE